MTSGPGTDIPSARRFAQADLVLVLATWTIATLVNVGKAAHVDDGAHLAIAEHILEDPLHPMRGTVFWGAHPEPIHALNQPHLFFYAIAAALWASHGSLVAAQLVLALFVLPGLFAFHALALQQLRDPAHARLATVLVFLGPGFLPGQNIMCDAPLVSLICVATWALLTAEGARLLPRLAIAGAAIGLACLVKYTAIALLPLFVLDAIRARDARRLLPLGIALALLAAYAAFNVADYGGVHILERHPGGVGDFGIAARIGITFARAALFVLTLGAIAAAPWALTLERRPFAIGAAVFVVLVVATRIVAAVGPAEMRDEPWAVTLLRTFFFLSGVLAIARVSRSIDLGDRSDVLLAGSIALLTAFVVVLSPFIAVRHALLVLPGLTLLVLRRVEVPRSRSIALGILTILIGLAVAGADRVQADAYREAGQRYRERGATPGRVWFVGHWGWQWYAADAGLVAYDPGVSVLAPGDLLVRPRLPDPQPLDPRDEAVLTPVDETAMSPGVSAIARTITTRQGYYAVWQGLPYGPSDEPLETFTTYRVTGYAAGAAQ